MTGHKLSRALFLSTILSTAVLSVNTSVRAEDANGGQLFVTGSRLDQSTSFAPAPVTQIGGDEIRTLGFTRVEDLLNTLPQAFAAQTTRVSGDATGTSQLNLRGLGTERTLVLVDGKRLPYGSPSSISSNLDFVPTQLIERIDVVTGGASAVYGSDAIAGVVNFVMRRDFEGIEFDGQAGFYQDSNSGDFANAVLGAGGVTGPGGVADGRNTLVSILFGANSPDGRGNVTAFLSYQDQNEIRADARDYSACAYGGSPASPSSVGGVGCVGSSSFRRFFTPGGNLFLSDDGTFVPFTGAQDQTFNFASANFIQRPLQRFNFSTFARYEITDNVEAYLDLSFMDNSTTSQMSQSALFFRPFQVNCDNPFLTAPVSTGGVLRDSLGCSAADVAAGANVPLSASYRNVEGDPRQTFIGNSTWRIAGGFRGEFDNNWQWDAYGQYGRVEERQQFRNDLNVSRVQDALFAVSDGAGGAVCSSGNANCAPYNIFQRPGGQSQVSQGAVNYIQGVGFTNGNTEQKIIGATLHGDLGAQGFQFPWAANGVQALVGAEWREDSLSLQPDDLTQFPVGGAFTGGGFGGLTPVEGRVRVTELFMETQIPLIEGKPFFEQLSLNGAYRYSDYSVEGNGVRNNFDAHSFGGGVNWSPSPDIHFRAQFQRAIRAPNVTELFAAQRLGFINAFFGPTVIVDPCATGVPAATLAQCAFTGVTPAQYGSIPDNPAGVLNTVVGGNPNLSPEKSDTYTVGVVLTPSSLPGFNLAVDYFDISVNGAVGTIPPQTSLSQCLVTGRPVFCDLINRDAAGSLFLNSVDAGGNLVGVLGISTNVAKLSTRGLDISTSYGADIGGWGSLNLSYAASVVFERSTNAIPDVVSTIQCKSLYAGQCANPNPAFRHRMVTTWQTPWNMDLTAAWRYTSGVDLDSGAPSISTGGTGTPSGNVIDDRLDSASYLDLAAQWHLRENATIRAGIQNVFGRDPELTTVVGAGFRNGNTYSGVYDPFGRFFYFGITLSK
jgi:iron complex outermembrane recepter protein